MMLRVLFIYLFWPITGIVMTVVFAVGIVLTEFGRGLF